MSIVYRHKLSADVTAAISRFASVHAYDNRKDYKEHWRIWVADNAALVAAEREHLTSAGYTGDLEDKMFKAGRYYFRKKAMVTPEPPRVRRAYVGTSRSLLEAIDQFLSLREESSDGPPAQRYQRFIECESYYSVVSEEIERLAALADISEQQAALKIKKTFKNRYYTQNQKRASPV